MASVPLGRAALDLSRSLSLMASNNARVPSRMSRQVASTSSNGG